jgi:hypothetical protein
MAITGATTATSLTELINSEFINDFIADCLGNFRNPSQFFLPINITNGASTVSQARWVSDVGTVPEDGAAVDTEFDATEATDLVANELETTDSTFSVVEYGLLREPSDTALEDAAVGSVTPRSPWTSITVTKRAAVMPGSAGVDMPAGADDDA